MRAVEGADIRTKAVQKAVETAIVDSASMRYKTQTVEIATKTITKTMTISRLTTAAEMSAVTRATTRK